MNQIWASDFYYMLHFEQKLNELKRIRDLTVAGGLGGWSLSLNGRQHEAKDNGDNGQHAKWNPRERCCHY